MAAPPRRQLVVRKPPLWRRPWVWVLVGLVVVGGIVAGILVAVGNSGERARTERETNTVQDFMDQVREQLPAEIQPVPPDLLVIFPNVSQELPQIGKEITPADAREKGQAVTQSAQEAADGIEGLQINSLIPAEFAGLRSTFTDAQFLMVQSFRTYERIGALMELAADVTGKERRALVDQAQQLTSQAGALFDRGYGKIVRVANRLRVNTTVTPPPSPTPTATTEPSPSPST